MTGPEPDDRPAPASDDDSADRAAVDPEAPAAGVLDDDGDAPEPSEPA